MSGPNVYGISRSIWTDGDFAPEPFTEREAWMWLVGAAAWKDTKARGNAGPVKLLRGEFSFSVRFLATKWQWTKDKTHRLLKRFEKRDMIRDTSRDGSQIYSVKNYNRFQVVGLPKRDSDQDTIGDASATAPRQHRDKEETGKQLNREKKEGSATAGAAASTPPSKPVVEPVKISEPVAPPSEQPDLLALRPPFLNRMQPQQGAEVVALVPQAEREIAAAVEAYNLTARQAADLGSAWPECQHLSDTRRKKLKVRLAECGGIEGWKVAMAKAIASSHLLGKKPRSAEFRDWRPDFDFFLQAKSFTKLMEGAYDDHEGNSGGAGAGSVVDRVAAAAAFANAAGDPAQRAG